MIVAFSLMREGKSGDRKPVQSTAVNAAAFRRPHGVLFVPLTGIVVCLLAKATKTCPAQTAGVD